MAGLVWFSSLYVVSMDTGHIAQSPQSGRRWSPAFKMEPVCLFPLSEGLHRFVVVVVVVVCMTSCVMEWVDIVIETRQDPPVPSAGPKPLWVLFLVCGKRLQSPKPSEFQRAVSSSYWLGKWGDTETKEKQWINRSNESLKDKTEP